MPESTTATELRDMLEIQLSENGETYPFTEDENCNITDINTERLIEWRERIGMRLMHVIACLHDGDDFGPGAVCVTCFGTVQRIGAVVEADPPPRAVRPVPPAVTEKGTGR